MASTSATRRAERLFASAARLVAAGQYRNAVGAARLAVRCLSGDMDSLGEGIADVGCVEVACSAHPVRTLEDMSPEEIAAMEREYGARVVDRRSRRSSQQVSKRPV